jgi:hypothetical protein
MNRRNVKRFGVKKADFFQAHGAPSPAACRVFTSSMAMVMGPTPPGTGVIHPATSLHAA